jgi:NAD(P)-dependent dehydrogenase (short-subunit alcohol dehydrogenase family)
MSVLAGVLSGQHALITGGGSGIGLACAHAFVRDGAKVTLMGRDPGKLQSAVKELSAHGEAQWSAGDVGDESAVERAVAQANAWSPLTIAVANAGTGTLGTVVQTSSEEWRRVMQTNLDGTFYTFKHAGLAIARAGGGAMCAISSIAGLRTHRFMSTYCVTKAGIDMLVRNTADEMGTVKVRVNSVCPGLVDTEIAQGLFTTDDVHQDYLDCMPLERTGMPDDIGRAVRFLCGPESAWITGVNLPVDGGHHLRRGPNLDSFARAMYGDKPFGDLQ